MGTYKVRDCLRCGKTYFIHIRSKVCKDCKTIELEKKEREKPVFVLNCPECRGEFSTIKTNKKFCSRECRRTFNAKVYKERKKNAKNSI